MASGVINILALEEEGQVRHWGVVYTGAWLNILRVHFYFPHFLYAITQNQVHVLREYLTTS